MSRKKLRILEVNKAYFPHIGGIETLVQQYSQELGQLGGVCVKTLVCRDGRGGTVRENLNGVDLVRAGSLGTLFKCPVSPPFVRHFRRLARKADVVHIHVPFPLADFALLLSGFKGRVVVSWHSDVVRQKKLMLFYKPFMMYLLRRADCILVATERHIDGSDWLPAFREKCRVLPYGITPEEYLPADGTGFLTSRCREPGAVKVFFTGRLVYYKGVDVLLRAFRQLDANAELFIAGTGDLEEELKRQAEEWGISGKVHFLGFLPEKELKQAYADCDIFVLPSVAKSEAFGIVQLEAMIYGKPVINTSLPSGVPHVSIHGETGLTVPPSDDQSLAGAIRTLAGSAGLRSRYGAAAKERVMNEFNEKNIIRRLYSVLSEDRGTI